MVFECIPSHPLQYLDLPVPRSPLTIHHHVCCHFLKLFDELSSHVTSQVHSLATWEIRCKRHVASALLGLNFDVHVYKRLYILRFSSLLSSGSIYLSHARPRKGARWQDNRQWRTSS